MNFILKRLATNDDICYNIKLNVTVRDKTGLSRPNLLTQKILREIQPPVRQKEGSMKYKTKGTCSSSIEIELDGDVIKSVSFTGGCNGNLQGISRLVEGMKARDAITRLKGIRCGFKPTSCPDQLALALESIMEDQQ